MLYSVHCLQKQYCAIYLIRMYIHLHKVLQDLPIQTIPLILHIQNMTAQKLQLWAKDFPLLSAIIL